MADTDTLIKQWEASRYPVHKAAAGITRMITEKKMQRYAELPLNSVLADQYDASENTITAAKKLLRYYGILILDKRRYYVA